MTVPREYLWSAGFPTWRAFSEHHLLKLKARSSMMAASMMGSDAQVIRVLIEAGADVNMKGREGFSSLMLAAAHSQNPEVVLALVEAGAELEELDKNGLTPLMFAALMGSNAEVVSVLLKSGADPLAKSPDGKSVLNYVEENEKLKETKAFWEIRDSVLSRE